MPLRRLFIRFSLELLVRMLIELRAEQRAHPFDRLHRADLPVTVNTDSRLTIRTASPGEPEIHCPAPGYTTHYVDDLTHDTCSRPVGAEYRQPGV
jgi:hypothetical protein